MFHFSNLETLLTKLVFSRKRKLYLIEILMIKTAESNSLDPFVYRDYTREVIECCLQLEMPQKGDSSEFQ